MCPLPCFYPSRWGRSLVGMSLLSTCRGDCKSLSVMRTCIMCFVMNSLYLNPGASWRRVHDSIKPSRLRRARLGPKKRLFQSSHRTARRPARPCSRTTSSSSCRPAPAATWSSTRTPENTGNVQFTLAHPRSELLKTQAMLFHPVSQGTLHLLIPGWGLLKP